MIYAIFKNGGKQYRVSVGQVIRLEKLNYNVGDECIFGQVVMFVNANDFRIGDPFLSCCNIVGKVVRHGRFSKVLIVKFRRRKHFRKLHGHRQWFTDVRISEINF